MAAVLESHHRQRCASSTINTLKPRPLSLGPEFELRANTSRPPRLTLRPGRHARSARPIIVPPPAAMDHAWYARDVADLLRWRRVATAVWGSAMSILAALAYLAFARFRPTPWGVVAATLSPTEWTKRVAHALALALAQLPAHITAVALMRPSLAPLRIVGGDDDGAVDPYGGFAEPGSAGRFAASRVPPHLFPAGFGPSRWCATPSPTNTAAAEAKDAIAHLTAFAAHVLSGAASCVVLRRGAVTSSSEGLVHAARFGAVLGALVAAHFAGTGARNCAFPAAARPRWMRVKRCAPAAAWRGIWFSLAAAGAHAGLRVALTLRGEMATADGVVSLVRVVFDFWFREVSDAFRMVPCGFACAGGWLAARAAANVVLTERYKFLPQSLADGPVSASAPLLASLVATETPFAQHAAYQDLCAVCEDGGGGRRALLLADKRGDAYAPAMAAALAPVIAVTCAMRAALDAAERADRGIVGGAWKSGSNKLATTGGGVKLRVASSRATGAADAMGAVDGGRSAPPTPAAVAAENDAGGASAGDLAGAAAWSMIADEWGVSPSAPPPPAASRASRALDDATPATQGAPPKMYAPDRASHSSAPTSGATLTARQLRHQMERPVVAAAEECVAAIAAYGRLASWGARAAAALAGVDARGDPNGVVGARSPTAAQTVRVLLAATHAARVCERAGAGAFGAGALGRGASSSSSSRRMSPRVPHLAPAAGPAAALADAFQTALFGLVSRYGGDEVRAMAAGGDPAAVGEFGDASGLNGETRGVDAVGGLAGLTGAARREAEIARGLRAPVELERTLEALLKWE